MEPADLLIIAEKYTHLQEAIKAVKNHVGENTIILSVLNGIESEKDIDYWLKVMNKLNPSGMPSMVQDVKAKRYSEVELFAGTIVRLGKKHNVSVPTNSAFYKYFTKLEASY